MTKILIRKSSDGIMSLRDTRIYNPRSESSTMFRANNDDESTGTGQEDSKYRDERTEKKRSAREERAKEMKEIPHLPITIETLEEDKDEDLEPTKFDNELEPSLMTGTHGNMGALTSLATQARGPGFAGGHAFAMGEPMSIAWLLLKSDWDDLQSMYSNTHPIDTIDGLIDDFGDGDDEEIPYGGFGPNGETARWFDDIMGNVSQGHTWYDDEDGGHFNSPERWRHYNAMVAEGNLTYGPERWRHYNAIVPHSDDYSGWEPKQALDTVHHGTDKQFNSNSTDEEKIRHGLDLFPLMLGEDGVFSEEAPDWRASDNIAQWAVGDQWHNSAYGLKTIEKHFPDMKRDDIQRILREHAKGNDQFGNAYPDYSQQPHEEDWWYSDDDYNDGPIATGEPMDIAFQLLKRDERQGFIGKKPKRKKGSRARKDHKERSKKWRPSTGEFKRPPGGMTPGSATSRRAKARMRGIKGGKKTGLSRAHLAVEMSHRGVKTKQPMSKDPRRYRQYLGQSEARKRLGNVRTVAATPSRYGARSYRAGKTGGGTLQSLLPGQAAGMRAPPLRRVRAPPLVPPRMPRAPSMPSAPAMPGPPPIPQARSGYANQSMMGGPQYVPSRMPSATVQGGPSMVMTSKVGVGSDLQKRGLSYYDVAELRQLVNEARRALKRKESKKKGKGDRDTSGAGSNLPRHNNAPTKETTRPEGATEDANNDPRTFGTNPLEHLTSRGGRTP